MILEKSIADECPQWPEFQPLFLDDTHFAFPVRRPDSPTDDFYSIYIYDLELNLINKLIPRANNDELCLRRLFQMTLEAGAEGPFYWERFTDTLYYFDLERDAKAAYHFTITENKISKEFLADPMTWKPGEKFYHLIGITDLSKHLIIRTNLDNRCLILYDKKKKEAFRVNDFWQCDTTNRESKFSCSLDNDVFGFELVRIEHYQKEEHLFPFLLHLDYTGSTKDLKCILQKKVTHPGVRDQLMEMVKNCTGEELPVLVLMHLK